MKSEILHDLADSLLREEGLVRRIERSSAGRKLSAERKTLNDILRRVLRSRDLSLIIRVETALVVQDLEYYANSRSMEKSLHTGLAEMQAVARHLELVTDKARYRVVDQLHNIPKTRKGEPSLPLDAARLALAGHYTRLDNMDRSRLSEEEKEALDTRKAYMRAALGLYIDLQKISLEGSE